MSAVLFIDGENFKKKCGEVLFQNGIKNVEFDKFDFSGLFETVLEDIDVESKVFYAAKINKHPQTPAKSLQLIEQQRRLKTYLESNGFDFIISGQVRGYEERDPYSKRTILTFKEKGVDVKIAVDLVSGACTGEIKVAILASSDSDLQPAIHEAVKRGVEIIYLGFESSPNKGMTYTTQRTILIRNSEILKFYRGSELLI
jgi:uncharacterized LabA/DUF88 family protein